MAKLLCCNKNFEIHLDKPVSQHSNALVNSYEATNKSDPTHKYYASICMPKVIPRFHNFETLKSINAPLVKPIDYDFIKTDKFTQKCPVFVFAMPEGGRVYDPNKRYDELMIIEDIIRPMAYVIEECHSHRITHRNINPGQLFYFDDNNKKILLGESITTPAGSLQPKLFEPISSMMANPLARPENIIEDDLYAMGMTIAVLYQTNNPLLTLSTEEIFNGKVEKSSYWFVAEKISFSSRVSQLLNGLLADNPRQRWSIDTVNTWLRGDKVSHIVDSKKKSIRKQVSFNNKKYYNIKTLAHALGLNPRSACLFIREGKLTEWLNMVGQFELAKKAEYFISHDAKVKAGNNSTLKDYLLIARICLLLDPLGPVYFNKYAFDFYALGNLFPLEFDKPHFCKTVHDLYSTDLAKHVINYKSFSPGIKSQALTLAGDIQTYLSKQIPGYGIERCLYELSPNYACQSPLIKEEYIFDIYKLIDPLEASAKSGQKVISIPMEKHLLSFMAAHSPKELKGFFAILITSSVLSKSVYSLLKIFEHLQRKSKNKKHPYLTKQFQAFSTALSQIFHSKKRRETKAKSIEKATKDGLFSTILHEIDKVESRQQDEKEFRHAKKKFLENCKKIAEFESPIRKANRETIGFYLASIASLLIGVSGFFLLLFTH